jgi:hypothetical protein
MFIPDSISGFLPIPDPGVKKAPDTGSGTLEKYTRGLAYYIYWYSSKT